MIWENIHIRIVRYSYMNIFRYWLRLKKIHIYNSRYNHHIVIYYSLHWALLLRTIATTVQLFLQCTVRLFLSLWLFLSQGLFLIVVPLFYLNGSFLLTWLFFIVMPLFITMALFIALALFNLYGSFWLVWLFFVTMVWVCYQYGSFSLLWLFLLLWLILL